MAVVTLLGTQLFNTTNGTKTVTATPAVGDLIVLVCAHTGNTGGTAPTDNNSDGLGTYAPVQSNVKNASADALEVWVRNALIGSASSTVFTHAPGTTSGGGLGVFKATGMSRTGASAVLQSAGQSNQAASGTPTLSWGATLTSTNAIIAAVFNATSPAGLTPISTTTERFDVGYSSPVAGLEACTRDSLAAVSSTPWGSSSASAFCCSGIELDTSAAPAGGKIMVRIGAAWLAKPVKVWSGSAWVEKPLKRWSGSAWTLATN